ncbi:MAG: DEAD/DEAH box helicase [Syntrophaceae bacterium]|nr:DEAD/DEAH box helicase [Syntrophaceae bacterium]
METLREALGKLEAPLRFSSGNEFRNLALLRDLEEPFRKKITALREMVLLRVRDAGLSGRIDRLLAELDALAAGFDRASPEERKRRVSEGLARVEAIRAEFFREGGPGERPVPKGLPREALLSLEEAVEKLAQPVQFVKGVGPKVGQLLARKGLKTVEDLLFFLPRKYEDRRVVKPIARIEAGRRETVVGKVVRAEIHPYKKRRVFEALIRDDTATLEAKWFKGSFAYMRNAFKPGCRVILTGEVKIFQLHPEMVHPDFEILEEGEDSGLHFRRIVPIYSETEGLGQRHLRRILLRAVEDYARCVPGPIPRDICERLGLMDIIEAVRGVHFPGPSGDMELLNGMRSEAHRRLIFDELFYFELAMALKHAGNVLDEGIAFRTGGELSGRFPAILPFTLTAAQERVIGEIRADMARPSPMHRLLQGDVGSGKTVVCMAAMLTACENGYQAALMAPTEILAEQHHRNIERWAEALGLRTALLLGGMRSPEKRGDGPPDRDRRGPDGRGHPRAHPGRGGFSQVGTRRRRRATPLRRRAARNAAREGNQPGRPGDDGHPHPEDARYDRLRGSGHLGHRRKAPRQEAGQDEGLLRAGAPPRLRDHPQGNRQVEPGLHRLSPRHGIRGPRSQGCHAHGRAPAAGRVPGAAPRADPRPHEGAREGGDHEGLQPPGPRYPRGHNGHRGGDRHPAGLAHGDRARRAVRACPASPAAGARGPRRHPVLLRPDGGIRGLRERPQEAGHHGADR